MNKRNGSNSTTLSHDERSIFINKAAMDKNQLKKALASMDEDDDFEGDPLSMISSKRKSKKKEINRPMAKKLKSGNQSDENSQPSTLNRNNSNSKKTNAIVIEDEDSSESHYVESSTITIPTAEKVIQFFPKAVQSIQSVRNAQELINEAKKKRPLRSSVVMDEYSPKSPEINIDDAPSIILQLKAKNDAKAFRFKINKDDPLKKLVDYYAKAKSVSVSGLILKLDGITLLPSQTPRDLELNQEDCLLIEQRNKSEEEENLPLKNIEDDELQITGEKGVLKSSSASLTRTKTEVITTSEENENLVKLKVRDGSEKTEKKYKVAKDEPLRKLMEDFCKSKNYPLEKVKFLFDGEVISPDSTPAELDLEDDFIIDCMIK